jgi:hypothetical protein
MTPDQKTLAIWGGSLAAAIIAGWIWLDINDDKLSSLQVSAENLKAKYKDLYPDTGIPVSEATKKWKKVAELQTAALSEAEAALVPAMPKAYTETELSSAAGQVRTDLLYLKQKADRQMVKLPSTLPFEEGLDPEAKNRGMQLAELYLYKNALDDCMDAGVTVITTVHAGKGGCDPYEKYAIFLCDIDIETTFEKAEALMLDLVQKQNAKGYGIRSLSLEQTKTGNERISLTFSLLVANDPSWGLKSEKNAAPAGGPTRFGRMGG